MIEGWEIMKLKRAINDRVIVDGEFAYAGNLFCSPIIYLARNNDRIFEDINLSWEDYCGEFNVDKFCLSHFGYGRGYFFPYLSIYNEKGKIYGYTLIKTEKLDSRGAKSLDITPYLEITRGVFQDEESNIAVVKVEKIERDRDPRSYSKDYYLRVIFEFSDKIMVGFYPTDDCPLLLLPKREVYVAIKK